MIPSPLAEETTVPAPLRSGNSQDRNPARGPRADQRRLSRQRLIDAARELCAEGRFLGCAVSDIADKAQISRAGFYLHFKSKEDLLGAVMSDQLDWYVEQHDTMTEQRAATVEGIVGWLEQFIAGFRNAGELFEQFSTASPTGANLRMQQTNRLRGVEALGHRLPALRLFRDDGAIDPDRRRRVLLYTYQMEQACMMAAYSDDAADVAATLRLLAEDFQRLMRE